jgi:hypothetical protein
MTPSGLTNQEDLIALSIGMGCSIEEAAEENGVSPRAVSLLLRRSNFNEVV